MSEFRIIQIQSMENEDLIQSFIELPFKVREQSYQIGLAPREQTRALMGWALNNGSALWVVKSCDDSTILRIAARACPHKRGWGTIGFFEVDLNNSSAKIAFDDALRITVSWLKDHGVNEIAAPVDINTWFNYRFSLPGKKFFPRFKWEVTSPPAYLDFFKENGFQDYAYYNSVFFPHIRVGEYCLGAGHLRKSYYQNEKKGFTLRPFDMEHFMDKEVPLFHEISHEAFDDALLFEPIDLKSFSALYAGAVKQYDFSPSCVLLDPAGEVGGFLFAFFDGDYLVIKSIAIRKKYQGLKLSPGMIFSAVKKAFAKNKKGTISALVRTGLASEKITRNSQKWMFLAWVHDYVLLKKEIKE